MTQGKKLVYTSFQQLDSALFVALVLQDSVISEPSHSVTYTHTHIYMRKDGGIMLMLQSRGPDAM
jgi:hypothetical protein